MVKGAADYPWSSYRYNALGEEDILITEHKLYQNLAESFALRVENYQKIFDTKHLGSRTTNNRSNNER